MIAPISRIEGKLDLRFAAGTNGRLDDACRAHGDLFRIETTEPGRDAIVIGDPDIAGTVLASDHGAFSRGITFERYAILLGNGLLLAEGDDWKARRQRLQTCFRRDVLPRFQGALEACNATALERWRERGAIDLAAEALELSLDFNLRALYGDDHAQVRAVAGPEFFTRLVEEPPSGLADNLRFVKKFRAFEALTRRLLDERRRRGAETVDFLGLLAEAYPDANDATVIVQEMMTLLMAGYATVGSAVQWLWWHLAAHPRARRAIERELAALHGMPTVPALAGLTAARRAVNESLRLKPPIWVITRRAADASTIAGIALEPGTHVLILPGRLHRHPAHWQDADRFDPDRFDPVLAHRSAGNERNRFAFVPFGTGPRTCIGAQLSTIELTYHLAAVLPKLELEPAASGEPEGVAGPVQRACAMPMQVSAR